MNGNYAQHIGPAHIYRILCYLIEKYDAYIHFTSWKNCRGFAASYLNKALSEYMQNESSCLQWGFAALPSVNPLLISEISAYQSELYIRVSPTLF